MFTFNKNKIFKKEKSLISNSGIRLLKPALSQQDIPKTTDKLNELKLLIFSIKLENTKLISCDHLLPGFLTVETCTN